MDNDENAMLITGNSRLAAVIATEFMRMFDHYKSRFYIDQTAKKNKKRKENGLPPEEVPTTLTPDSRWSDTAFNPNANSHKFADRIVFSGQ